LPLVLPDDDSDFQIDWNRLENAITLHTRAIILNFPHNPTGAILSPDDLDKLAAIIAAIIRDTSTYLISDEVYEHIIFDQADHQSLLRHDELWERSFVISSFGKTYHATGWKVGYCVAPPVLSAEFRKIHQWTCFAVITPIQHAIADYMEQTPNHYAELPVFYEHKRDKFCELVNDSRFRLRPTAGTLTKEIGVASIPISVFCDDPPPGRKLRFCFAKDDDILEDAASRLCRL
jgi:methionine aminotransferase